MNNTPYDKCFYDDITRLHNKSMPRIVSTICEFIKPDTVIDIGCGNGAFLAEWISIGVVNVLGIDGEYVDSNILMIPENKFRSHDLTTQFQSTQCYSIACSLEVAEHLDVKYAKQFINMLCKLSDIVVFSAAIPGQSGRHHINEQWQSYWCELFNQQGYVASDYIRKRLAGDNDVNSWYRQNIVTYVKKEKIEEYPLLKKYIVDFPAQLDMVVPDMWHSEWMELYILSHNYDNYTTRKLTQLTALAQGRKIVLWGAGLYGTAIDFICKQQDIISDYLFVDTYKERESKCSIPITPLSMLESSSGKYFVIITLGKKNRDIELKLNEMGYGKEDYVYFYDVKV